LAESSLKIYVIVRNLKRRIKGTVPYSVSKTIVLMEQTQIYYNTFSIGDIVLVANDLQKRLNWHMTRLKEINFS